MKKNFLLVAFFLLGMFNSKLGTAQISNCQPCTDNGVKTFTVNMTASPNMTASVTSNRFGQCCQGSGSDKCIRFIVSVHPSAAFFQIQINPGNNGTWEIDCDPGKKYTPADKPCLNGLTNFCVTYCNPGNNNDTYTFTTSNGFTPGPDLSLRLGCTKPITVQGLQESSITWQSVVPNNSFNTFLSCTSGCDTANVTPTSLPSGNFVDYKVCGQTVGCSVPYCDTIRVNVTPAMTLTVTPSSPVICSSQGSVTLTATATGGVTPYNFSWSGGGASSTKNITVAGFQTVTVGDASSGCAPLTQTINVTAAPTPTLTATPASLSVCSGNSTNISLFSSSVGTTYAWTVSQSGVSGASAGSTATSSINQTLTATGSSAGTVTYTITPTANGCSGTPTTLTFTVSPAPNMTLTNGGTSLCSGNSNSVTISSTSAGATFSWTSSSNGATGASNSSGSSISDLLTTTGSSSGTVTYSITPTLNGCNGTAQTITFTVNPTPTVTSSNSASVCSGVATNISLTASTNSTFSWIAVNNASTIGESLTTQTLSTISNTITNSTSSATTVIYTVTPTAGSCTGPQQTLSVTVNPTPNMSSSSSVDLCTGNSVNLTLTSTVPSTFTWIAASNSNVGGESTTLQSGSVINNTLTNTGNAISSVIYTVTPTSTGGTCAGTSQSVTVSVVPTATMTSSNSTTICNGNNVNIALTSNIPSSYSWLTTANANVTDESTTAQSTASISDILVNTSTVVQSVVYTVTPTSTTGSCAGTPQTVSVTINPAPIITSATTATICGGGSVSIPLTSNVSSSFTWIASDNPSTTGESTVVQSTSTLANTIINTSNSAQVVTYTVTPTASTGSCPGVAETVSVTVNPSPVITNSNSQTICSGATLNLALNTNVASTFSWIAASNSNVTGESTAAQSGSTINNTLTSFGGSIENVIYSVTPTSSSGCAGSVQTITVSVNPAPIMNATSGSAICSGNSISIPLTANLASSFSWIAANNASITGESTTAQSSATILNTLTNTSSSTQNVVYTVIPTSSSGSCQGTPITVTATVNPTPQMTSATSSSICSGSAFNLAPTANVNSTFSWIASDNTNTTGESTSSQTSSIISNTITNNSNSVQSIIYSITPTSVGGSCLGSTQNVTVTVNPTPSMNSANTISICSGNSVNLSLSSSIASTYSWIAASNTNITGESLTAQSSSILNNTLVNTSTVSQQVIYTVTPTSTSNSCVGTSQTITVTVNPIPSASSLSSNTPVCLNGTINLTAPTVTGATYSWNGPGGFSSSNQNPTIPNASSSGTYSLVITANGCSSPTATTSVTVNSIPVTANPTSNGTICSGQNVLLNSSVISSATYAWTGPGGFTSSIRNPTISSASTSATGTYSLIVSVPGCGSTSTETVSVVVNQTPSAPVITGTTSICSGTNLNLSATSTAGTTFSWTGPNTFSATGSSVSVSSITSVGAGTYSVVASLNNCNSSTSTIGVTVNASDDPSFSYSSGTFCASGTNPSAQITGTAGGTFSASSAGLVIGNASTGLVNLSASTLGTYTVTYTTAGSCSTSSTFPITVTAAPTANFSFSGPFCTSGTNPLPQFTVGASAGIFSASSAGLVFANTSTGEIDLSACSAATYTVTNNIAAAGGCAAATFSTTVIIDAAATANGGNPITICAGTLATLNGTIGGSATSASWSGGTGTFSNSNSLTSTYTPAVGESSVSLVLTSNDPAGACTSTTDTVILNITPLPASPTVITDTVCTGSAALLQATAPGGTYQWFIAATGGTQLGTGANFTTPTIQFNVNFFVQTTVGSCTSPRIAVAVVALPIPAAPSVTGTAICTGTSTSLTASGGTSYGWYDTSSGGNLLATTSGFTSPVLISNTTYFVESVSSGCSSSRTAVTVTVSTIPSAPTVSNLSVCEGGTVTLSATAPGGTYNWYDAATGGNLLGTGISFATPAINSTTNYFVNSTIAGCSGPVTTVTVTAIPTPAAPTALGDSICAGTTAQLNASAPGPTYRWFSAPTGGSLLHTGSNFTTPVLNTNTSYYVQTTVTGCTSTRTQVTVTVTPLPSPPSVITATVCEGNTASISANPPVGGTVEWYDALTNGNLLSSSLNFTTPILNASTNYFVKSIVDGCSSSLATCSVTVNPLDNSEFSYSSGSFCVSGSNASPLVTSGVSGTYSVSPSGLNFSSASTGVINVGTSTPNTYTVTFSSNGTCPTSSTTTVTITNAFNATFSLNDTYCQGGINDSPQFTAGASAGVFSSTPSGLQFVSSSTGEIDLSNSGAGTYLITNNIAAAAGCAAASDTETVVIFPKPIVSVGNDKIVCEGSVVNLAGLIGGSATSASWSGGLGTFSNSNSLNTIYFPSSGETTLELVLSTDDPVGPCTFEFDTLNVTIEANPLAPTVTDVTICEGTSATLTAIAPGGTYTWFNVPSGGTSLSSGATFVSSPINTNTVFYAQTQVGACVSPRTPVNVQVIPQDDPSFTYAVGTLCSTGINPTPTVSGVPGGVFSVAPVGLVFINPNTGEVNLGAGNLNSFTVTYVTPGTCPDTADFVFTVTNGFDASFIYNSSYCSTSSNPSPTFPAGASAGIFTATPSGMVFQNAANGIIDISASTPGTYTVVNSIPASGLCAAVSDSTVVTIDPAATVDAGVTINVCTGDSANLLGVFGGSATQVTWSGGNGSFINDQNPNAIYVPANNESAVTLYLSTDDPAGACNAISDSVVVNFNRDTASFSYGAGTFCSSSLDPTPVIIGNYTGTYSASPSGLFFTDNTTGEIDLSASTQTTYTVTFNTNGICPNSFDQVITITGLTDASFSFNSNYCQNTISAAPLFSVGASAGTFSVSPSGLNFTDVLTGVIDLENTAPGSYIVTNQIPPSGSCASSSYTDTVVIDPAPIVNAGNSISVCSGVNSVTLIGSVTIGSTTGGWTTLGTGVFLPDSSQLNANYNLSSADSANGSVKLVLTSTNNGLCNAVTDTITINILNAVIVNAGNDSSVCSNESITLSGSLFGGTSSVVWTTNGTGNFATSDTSLQTTYLTSSNDVSVGQILFILTPVNACGNSKDTINFTINPGPQITATGDQVICSVVPSVQLGSTKNGLAGGQIWSVNGSGSFSPSDTSSNPIYNIASND
ncbi:MAG: beta strand repeat-containing protein, partial [Bacteroidota bacterium]